MELDLRKNRIRRWMREIKQLKQNPKLNQDRIHRLLYMIKEQK